MIAAASTYCPVVHTSLNWVVIGLLIGLIATIVVAIIANELLPRRGAT